MIRLAKPEDFDRIKELLRNYGNSAPVECLIDPDLGPDKRIGSILGRIMMSGYIFVGEDSEGLIQGVLISQLQRNTWVDSVVFLTELVFWVEPSARRSGIGSALIEAYTLKGQELTAQGQIEHFTMSAMSASPDLKLESKGWAPFETTYIHKGIN